MGRRKLDLSGSEYGKGADYCEDGNKMSDSLTLILLTWNIG